MQGEVAIKISNLSKKFQKDNEVFFALKGLSLEIQTGEVVGIIGKNGSGKSTLLKILSGILKPDDGEIEMYGSVASILDVGAGMHPDLTGKQNIYLRGQLLGLRTKEIDAVFEDLVAFSEIGDFINTPVKHYSSGMFVRLAFSIIVYIKADILILDEVMSVGDVGFMEKCNVKLLELTQDSNTTVLLVGHNIQQINNITTRAITLDHGLLVFDGDTPTAIEQYIKLCKSYYSPNTFESTGIKIISQNFNLEGRDLFISISYSSSDYCYYPVIRIKKLNQEIMLVDGTEYFKEFKNLNPENPKNISYQLKINLSSLQDGKYFIHFFFGDGNFVYELDSDASFVLGSTKEKLQNLVLKSEHFAEVSFK